MQKYSFYNPPQNLVPARDSTRLKKWILARARDSEKKLESKSKYMQYPKIKVIPQMSQF